MNSQESPKIFWSWQSDFSPPTCRTFVRAALLEAIEQINNGLGVHDADRPEIDHDTKDERGMVDIASTILMKIANAAVFVADLTPIAQSSAGKWLPNPNVMIELGWAMQKPGWERVIGVLNTASGAEIEDLPFDIRQRRVITYLLAEGADATTRKSVKKKLVKELKGALEVNLADRSEQIAAEATIVGTLANPQDPSIWATAKDTLVHNDSSNRPGRTEIQLPSVPRSYMRIIPAAWKTHPPAVADIAHLPEYMQVEAPHDAATSGDYGATEEGFVRYWLTGKYDQPPSSTNVTMFFEDTGEFWMLHGSVVVPTRDYALLRDHIMLGQWSRVLRRTMLVMDHYGALAARRVEAGLHDVRNLRWYAQWEIDQIQARRAEATMVRQSRDWSSDAQIEFLTGAYNRVRGLFALPRISEAEVSSILTQFDPERFQKKH